MVATSPAQAKDLMRCASPGEATARGVGTAQRRSGVFDRRVGTGLKFTCPSCALRKILAAEPKGATRRPARPRAGSSKNGLGPKDLVTRWTPWTVFAAARSDLTGLPPSPPRQVGPPPRVELGERLARRRAGLDPQWPGSAGAQGFSPPAASLVCGGVSPRLRPGRCLGWVPPARSGFPKMRARMQSAMTVRGRTPSGSGLGRLLGRTTRPHPPEPVQGLPYADPILRGVPMTVSSVHANDP